MVDKINPESTNTIAQKSSEELFLRGSDKDEMLRKKVDEDALKMDGSGEELSLQNIQRGSEQLEHPNKGIKDNGAGADKGAGAVRGEELGIKSEPFEQSVQIDDIESVATDHINNKNSSEIKSSDNNDQDTRRVFLNLEDEKSDTTESQLSFNNSEVRFVVENERTTGVKEDDGNNNDDEIIIHATEEGKELPVVEKELDETINAAPKAGDDVALDVNEGAAIVNGELMATDEDKDAVLSYQVVDGVNIPDGFMLSSDGSWQFDAQTSTYNSLNAGDQVVLTIPIMVIDEHGASDTAQIQITVIGTNDAPIAGASVFNSVNEGSATISSQLNSTDADDGATVSYAISSGITAPDGFVLNTDGSYSFDPADASYNHLNVGDSEVLTIPVTVTDDNGATDTSQIQITVSGTNDVPVAGAAVTATVDEGATSISGQLTSTDLDNGATATFTVSSGSTAPDGFVLNTDGSYSFDPADASYNHLNVGDSEVLTIPVTVTDDNGATDTSQIQITVSGTNDVPVAGASVSASVDEGSATISGQLTATDVDDGATATFTVSSGSTAPDGFVLNADGSYSFDPADASYNHLNVGDSEVITIPVTVTDDNGATDTSQIQITVSGTNDAPVAGASVSASVDEGATSISGQLTSTDLDDGATATFTVSSGSTAPDGFVLNADGSYTFDPADASYNHLNVGDSEVLTIPVTVTDDNGATDTSQIQITVSGTNDIPVAGAAVTATVDEGATSISGQLTSTDMDDGATTTFTVSSGSTVPDGFVLNADGSYSFDPADSAYDHLNAGDSEVLTVPITVTDDQGVTDTSQIQITVSGTNDAPIAGANVTANVDEGSAAIGGQLTSTDIDDGATATFTVSSGSTAPDGFVLNADGSYTFDPADASYNHLNVGDSEVLTIPVTVTDDNGTTDTSQIQITVSGTNDAPVAGASVSASVDEGATSISGQLTSTDLDDDATATFTVSSGNIVPDGFVLNTDGSYTFDPADASYNHLNVGDSEVITIPVTVTDDNGATDTSQIQITVSGTNDAPVAGASVSASVDEGATSISGQLTSTDLDDGATATFTVSSGSTAPDGFVLNTDGSYSFDPADSAYDHLNVGDSEVLTVPITVTDDNGTTDTSQIQITISGTNDVPVAGAAVTATVDEGNASISGQLTSTDLDDGATATFTVSSGSTAPDGFMLNTDGSYSFDPADVSYNHLNVGDSEVLTIPVTVTDDNGVTDTSQIQITVSGTNDTPVAGASVTANVDEGAASISGQLTATDLDDGATATFTVSSGSTAPDGFILNADGSYSFDPADASYNHLNVGDSEVLTIPVTVTDDNGATDTSQIQITVSGTNDAPVAGASVSASVDEGSVAIGGQLTSTDMDDGATTTFTVSSGSTVPDGFVLNADGSYSFDPADSAYDHLNAGDSEVLTIPVTVTDDHGASDTTQVKITVSGSNDAPTAIAFTGTSVDENAPSGTVVAQMSTQDVDDGETFTYSIVDDASGLFEISGNQILIKAGAEVDYESGAFHDVSVQVTDANGLTYTQAVSLTINDVNEAPTDIIFDAGGANVETALTVNDNGANNEYAAISDFNDFPTTRITLEMQFSSDAADVSNTSFASYATDGNNNEFLLFSDGNGDLNVYINGSARNTGIDASDLIDGESHQLSVTWDSQSGELNVYVDGNAEYSGTHQQGNPVTSGGTLVFGQEQDSVGGGFDASQNFEGTISDVRIFNEVRTSEQIADNANSEISNPGAESGLVSYYNFDNVSGNEIVDLAGSNTLTLFNGASVGDAISVDESATDGTVVAILSAVDEDAEDAHSYAITDDASGYFEIVGNEIQVKADADLDFEAANSHDITVEVTDGAGNTYLESITLSVSDINEAPTDIIIYGYDSAGNGALTVNDDGALNEYAAVSNFDDFPTTAISLEMQFSSDMTDTSNIALASYATSGSNNEFLLFSNGSGNLDVYINGSARSTGISTSDLIDGNTHQLSVTWDSASGELNVYVDGVAEYSGTHQQSHPIEAGGTLVFGQEQDSVGGGFDASQNFEGAISDVRIFDEVRTPEQIASNANSEISNPGAESGLVSYYNFNSENDDGVVDLTGGNTLTLNNGASVSSSFNASTAATVDENATTGTVVATLSSEDSDAGDSHTYVITDDASGFFEVVGNEVRVKAGADVNFENEAVHELTIQSTDSTGNTYSEVVSLEVNDVNEAPTDITFSGDTIDENSVGGTVVATLSTSDEDAGETFSYVLNDGSGFFEISGNQIVVKVGADIDFETDVSHSVSVEVTDSSGNTYTEDYTINVNDIVENLAPVAVDDVTEGFNPANASLTAEIDFDDGVPTALLGSVVTEANGQVGEAADFNAASVEVSGLNLNGDPGAQTTVSMWVQANPSGGWEMLAASDHYDMVMLNGDIGFNTAQGDLFGTDASELSDGEWHHVVGVFTNGDVTQNTIHIDGVEQEMSQIQGSPSSSSANIDSSGGSLFFGSWGANNNYSFSGSMDEVKVFNGPLSSEEVATLHDLEVNDSKWDAGTLNMQEDNILTINSAELLANDIDPDGDTLSISAVQDGDHGTVTLDQDGNVQFTPEENYSGVATFTYTVSDGNGGEDTATVTLNVTSVNDLPTINVVNTVTVDEDGSQQFTYSTSDIDSASVTLTADAANGNVVVNENGSITFTPDDNYFGEDTIVLTAIDSDGGITTQEISVTVNPIEDAPEAFDDGSFEPQTATLTAELNFDDGVPTALLGSVVTEANAQVGDAADFNAASVEVSGLNLNGDPGAQTTVSMWVQANPSGGWEMLAASDRYDMVMLNGDIGFNTARGDLFGTDASELSDGEWHHVVGVFTNGDVTQNTIHIDGVEQEMSQIQGAPSSSSANIDSSGGSLFFGSWGANNNYSFSGSMDEIKVFDGALSSEEVSTLHDMELSNNKWDASSFTTDEDASLVIDPSSLLANDVDADGDVISISSVQDAKNGTVEIDGDGNVVFTPDADYNGEASFTYTIDDGKGYSDTATATLNIESINDGVTVVVDSDAMANIISENVAIGSYTGITLDASDVDGDAISYSIEGDAPFFIDENGRVITNSELDFETTESYSINVTATSADGTTSTNTFTVDVADIEENNEMHGTWRSETIDGTEGNDVIYGEAGNDRINAGDGNDVLVGGDGNDTLNGGAGNDTFIQNAGDDNDVFYGGEGNDTVVRGEGDSNIGLAGNFGVDNSIETIDAGGNDVVGDWRSQTLDFSETSLENVDEIRGEGGNDRITGTSSDDTIIGGDGNDTLNGGAGNDTFIQNAGDDNDVFYGGEGNDTVVRGEGDSNIGLAGNFGVDNSIETIDAGGNDVVGDWRSQTLDFSETSLENVDEIRGEGGNDKIIGSAGNDNISGGSGNDALSGGDGNDILSGGSGNDRAFGEDGNDTYVMNPFDGSDYFSGGEGGGWTDAIDVSAVAANDPDSPWTIEVDGAQVEYDIAANALELNPDTAGVITFGDGSELSFDGVERIEW